MQRRSGRGLAASLFAALAGVCGLTIVQSAAPVWTGDVAVATQPFNQGLAILNGPGIGAAPDGAGGVILVWEDHQLGNAPDVYARVAAQRLSAQGEPLWGEGGIAVAPADTYQWQPEVVSDGAGGVIVFYLQSDAGACGPFEFFGCELLAQRLDADGEPVWEAPIPVGGGGGNEGVSGLAAVSDSAGGAIVAWSDSRFYQYGDPGGVFVQRVGANGTTLWQENGVNLARADALLRDMEGVSDGVGGAVFVWMESQPLTFEIRVQRVDSDGTPLWDGNVDPGLDAYLPIVPSVVTDGAGGVLLGFNVRLAQFEIQAVAQRIDGDGDVRWPNPTLVAPVGSFQGNVRLLADGTGGAIATWEDGSLRCLFIEADCDVHAQRISADGARLWSDAGVPIADRPTVERGAIPVSDGAGGALVFWNDCRDHPDPEGCFYGMDLYAQRIDATGQRRWRTGGIAVSTAAGNQGVSPDSTEAEMTLALLPDGAGGAFAAWPDGRSVDGCYIYEPGGCDLYAQRVVPGPDVELAACEDGDDDDGDGAYDYPADPGCSGPRDDFERSAELACDDGVDGDGDGRVDFPADPGCAAPGDDSEWSPTLICDNGQDDDGDGAIDGEDMGCSGLLDPTELLDTACENGRDDDGDGFADHPSEPGCLSPEDASELATCAEGDFVCNVWGEVRGKHALRLRGAGRLDREDWFRLSFGAGTFNMRDARGAEYPGTYLTTGRDRAQLRFEAGTALQWLDLLLGSPIPGVGLASAPEATLRFRASLPSTLLRLQWRLIGPSGPGSLRARLEGFTRVSH